jgi:hypothetical protein
MHCDLSVVDALVEALVANEKGSRVGGRADVLGHADVPEVVREDRGAGGRVGWHAERGLT